LRCAVGVSFPVHETKTVDQELVFYFLHNKATSLAPGFWTMKKNSVETNNINNKQKKYFHSKMNAMLFT